MRDLLWDRWTTDSTDPIQQDWTDRTFFLPLQGAAGKMEMLCNARTSSGVDLAAADLAEKVKILTAMVNSQAAELLALKASNGLSELRQRVLQFTLS